LSVRVCVLGSGSRGNSTLVVTEKTRLLVDAGFNKKETYARLAAIGETAEGCAALIISHEHSDHITGLKGLALDLKVPVYISAETRAAIQWDARVTAVETISAGQKFCVGDIDVTPFSIPHDAADPISNRNTADFLTDDFDGAAQVLVLAHLSENNNHPEIARMTALEALQSRKNGSPELHLASQTTPTKVFQF